MHDIWRPVKNIPFGDFRAWFSTLYEDKRDMMSDCVKPQWGIADRKSNRMVTVCRGRSNTDEVLRIFCTKDEGNALYKMMVKMDNHGYGRHEVNKWLRENGAKI
ncbi:MAG: hypothetical protein II659_08350 [Bacteroidales bacterium]|nr:hypothetical protein [Bacteroidales bacterium]